jgi:drug/metabolite transporter (DMT)-like permease
MAGVFLLGGYANIAFNTSMMYGNVVRSMALFYTLPLWALLGGYVFLGENISAWRGLAAACAIIGAWLVLGGVNILAAPPTGMDLLALSSGFAYAMNNLCFRATPQIAMAPKIATMFLSAAVFCAVSGLAGVGHFPQHLSPVSWLLASGFGLLWILLANMGTQWGVTHLEAGRAAVIIVLELVIAILSSLWWTDLHLSLVEWCGAGLVLLAALMEARDA